MLLLIKIDKVNIDEALRYMGYKNNINIDNISPILKKCEQELLNNIDIRYCYNVFDIEEINNQIKVKNTNLSLQGKSILTHLENCNQAVFMAATLSEKVDRLISKYNVDDMTSSIITDAMRSALVQKV